jgi:hypothetical protein
MYVWVAFSLASLAICLKLPFRPFAVPGVCGAIGASIYLLPSCRAVTAADLRPAVRRINLLCLMAAASSGALDLLCLLVSVKLAPTSVPLPPPAFCAWCVCMDAAGHG